MKNTVENFESNPVQRRLRKFNTEKTLNRFNLPQVIESTGEYKHQKSRFFQPVTSLKNIENETEKQNFQVKLISESEIDPDIESLLNQYKSNRRSVPDDEEILEKYKINVHRSSDNIKQNLFRTKNHDFTTEVLNSNNYYSDANEAFQTLDRNRRITKTIKDMVTTKQSSQFINKYKEHKEESFKLKQMKGVSIKVTESLRNKYLDEKEETPEKTSKKQITRSEYLDKCKDIKSCYVKSRNALFTSRTLPASCLAKEKIIVFGGASGIKKNDLLIYSASFPLNRKEQMGGA